LNGLDNVSVRVQERPSSFEEGRSCALLDMLFAEIVQHPKAHLSRRRHRKFGNRHGIKNGAEPFLRFQPQIWHSGKAVVIPFSHKASPLASLTEIAQTIP
jgi:hypothetical protein